MMAGFTMRNWMVTLGLSLSIWTLCWEWNGDSAMPKYTILDSLRVISEGFINKDIAKLCNCRNLCIVYPQCLSWTAYEDQDRAGQLTCSLYDYVPAMWESTSDSTAVFAYSDNAAPPSQTTSTTITTTTTTTTASTTTATATSIYPILDNKTVSGSECSPNRGITKIVIGDDRGKPDTMTCSRYKTNGEYVVDGPTAFEVNDGNTEQVSNGSPLKPTPATCSGNRILVAYTFTGMMGMCHYLENYIVDYSQCTDANVNVMGTEFECSTFHFAVGIVREVANNAWVIKDLRCCKVLI